MKQTIYKYAVEIKDAFTLQLPFNAKIISVQMQYGDVFMWAIVNPEAHNEKRTFEVFGTGHPMPEAERRHIGTFQPTPYLVFHLFERL